LSISFRRRAVFRQIGTRLDVAAQRRRVELAVGRGLAKAHLIDRAQPRQLGFAVGRRVVVVEVAVDRVLELVALLVVGLDAVLVEEPLEEDVLVREPGDLERRAGLHPELVGRRAQHVGRGDHAGGIEPLAVGDHRLAGGCGNA
jgi:hypothetical protein